MNTRLLIFIPVVVAGCATKPMVKPLTGPTDIPIESAANIRRGEVVKAYPINRYVDPADRRMMHERHVVYRVEEDASWRTASNATQQVLVGNTFTASRMERQPDTLRQEGPGIAAQQRALSQRVSGIETAVVMNAASIKSQGQALANEDTEIRETLQQEVKALKEEKASAPNAKAIEALQGEERIRYLEENKLVSAEDAALLRDALRKRGVSREESGGTAAPGPEGASEQNVQIDENGQIQKP